eukprot:7158692-Pyramimonas_sp.AAC.1
MRAGERVPPRLFHRLSILPGGACCVGTRGRPRVWRRATEENYPAIGWYSNEIEENYPAIAWRWGSVSLRWAAGVPGEPRDHEIDNIGALNNKTNGKRKTIDD